MNEYGLFTSNADAALSFSVIIKVVTAEVEAVNENVNDVPPTDDKADKPVAPPAEKVGVKKSPTIATADPSASNTVIVHEIFSLTRTIFVS